MQTINFYLNSAGIGEALSHTYANDKCSLVLIARNMGKKFDPVIKKKVYLYYSSYNYRTFKESGGRM